VIRGKPMQTTVSDCPLDQLTGSSRRRGRMHFGSLTSLTWPPGAASSMWPSWSTVRRAHRRLADLAFGSCRLRAGRAGAL